jgi:hypothetical protein
LVSAYNQRYNNSSDPLLREMLESKSIDHFIDEKLNLIINGRKTYGGNVRHILPQSYFINSQDVSLINIRNIAEVFKVLSRIYVCKKKNLPKLVYRDSPKTEYCTTRIASGCIGTIKEVFSSDYDLLKKCEENPLVFCAT